MVWADRRWLVVQGKPGNEVRKGGREVTEAAGKVREDVKEEREAVRDYVRRQREV